MDEDKVAKRFHSQLAHVNIHSILKQEELVVNQIKAAFQDIKERYPENVTDDRLLIIKQFPAGTLDVNGLRAFIVKLVNEGFKPALVVVDYVGEMKDFTGLEVWESRQRLCRICEPWASRWVTAPGQPYSRTAQAVMLRRAWVC